jgi:hypothetical protein
MKLSSILLLAFSGVGAKKEETDLVEPQMQVLQDITFSDKKMCADGEYVEVSCGIKILEPFEEVTEKDRTLQKNEITSNNNLRRRLPKEDKVVEPQSIYYSAEMGLEITDCNNSLKGANMTNRTEVGRDLIAEGEALGSLTKFKFTDSASNEAGYIVRQGRISFFEEPSYEQELLGITKGPHVGNILWKVILDNQAATDEKRLWSQFTMTIQAAADAIMYNDTGFLLNEVQPEYNTNVKIIDASLEWEPVLESPCSPDWAANTVVTETPSIAPSPAPSESGQPTMTPSVSVKPSVFSSTKPPSGCAYEFRLRLETDDWGGEISYKLTDSLGNVIVQSPIIGNNSIINVEECLPDGSVYTFTISDSSSDGICCSSGSGNYQIYYNSELVYDSPGTFLAEEVVSVPGGLVP